MSRLDDSVGPLNSKCPLMDSSIFAQDSISLAPLATALTDDGEGPSVERWHAKGKSKHARYFQSHTPAAQVNTDAVDRAAKAEDWLRAHPVEATAVRTQFHKERVNRRNEKIWECRDIYSDSKILNIQDQGYAKAMTKEKSVASLSQRDILRNANLLTASKRFDLSLDKFGPYLVDYTRNGRHLLLAGRKGHLSGFDWQTKELHFEINVMEKIRTATWLHNETFLAVAQKRWTYVYDKQGVEIHCLKALDRVTDLTFLPYHFILVSLNASNYMNFLDVSTGKIITGFNVSANLGKARVLRDNPSNGISITGHSSGCVNFWSPNSRQPLVTMLTHGCPIQDIRVDSMGSTLATCGADRRIKLWDLRMYKLRCSHKLDGLANQICFSQTDKLAVSSKQDVKIFDIVHSPVDGDSPQQMLGQCMEHRETGAIASLQFCPFEDVLGIGHADGFSSILVPGSGEANFDAYELNPYETKQQRRHAEIRALIDKIPYELITLDNTSLYEVDIKTAISSEDAKQDKTVKISAKKTKRLKKVKLGKRLVSLRKMREMTIAGIVRKEAEGTKMTVKRKSRKELIDEDPLFGRFKKVT